MNALQMNTLFPFPSSKSLKCTASFLTLKELGTTASVGRAWNFYIAPKRNFTYIQQVQSSKNEDVFKTALTYLTLKELALVSRVCIEWNRICDDSTIWGEYCKINHFPVVVNRFDGARTTRNDLKILYPMTVCGRKIAQIFGRPIDVRVTPQGVQFSYARAGSISEFVFNQLFGRDPFDSTKRMKESFRFVCDFRYIMTESGNNSPSILPFETKEMYRLCSSLATGEECGVILEQNNTIPNENITYLSRRDTVGHDIENENDLKAYVKDMGSKIGFPQLGLTTFRIRSIYDAAEIHFLGTCPEWTREGESEMV
jgi:hypothetical protein